MAVCSFGLVPIVEELLYRGYCQRRLSEDWGDGPAVVGTTLLLLVSHGQYLRLDAYNIALMTKLALFGVIAGVAFAWTKSLIPSLVAHVILNVPMTTLWEMIVMAGFAVGGLFIARRGTGILRTVFSGGTVQSCVVLGVAGAVGAFAVSRMHGEMIAAVAAILVAFGLQIAARMTKQAGASQVVSR